jgi:hypothetical protein
MFAAKWTNVPSAMSWSRRQPSQMSELTSVFWKDRFCSRMSTPVSESSLTSSLKTALLAMSTPVMLLSVIRAPLTELKP